MRRIFWMVAALWILATTIALAQFYSENVTSGASGAAVPTLSNWNLAEEVRVAITSASASYVRFSRDLLPNADFESFLTTTAENPAGYPDMWDADGGLIGWAMTENTVTVELETTNAIYDRNSLRFESASVAELIANQDLELLSVNDFTDWTESVNAGTGTITSIETGMYDLLEAAELTGGSAHVDFTSATTVVVASTSYVLSVWGDITAAGDLLDIRIREATGGTDFLQANGTWAAGEIDFCNATFDDGANGTYTQCIVEFTTDTGITGLTISANVDVSADVGRVDAFSLHVDDNTVAIQATSLSNISDTVADSYVCAFTQDAAAASSARAEYAIIDPTDSDTGTNGVQVRYYTGSAWTTTETWLSSTYAATATQTRGYFEARVATGHPVQFRIRPETMGNTEDLYIDKAFCTATARAGAGILLAAAGDWYVFALPHAGRFTAISASGTNVVNFSQVR